MQQLDMTKDDMKFKIELASYLYFKLVNLFTYVHVLIKASDFAKKNPLNSAKN